MDRKLQRHRADSLRQHGFLVITVQMNPAAAKDQASVVVCVGQLTLLSAQASKWSYGEMCEWEGNKDLICHSRLKTHLFHKSFPP